MNARPIRSARRLAAVGLVAPLAFGPFVAPAASQEPAAPQEVELGERRAAHPRAFGLIGGVRELSDGRLLVADPLGGELLRLDADLGSAARLGTEGEGPGEYRQPDAVWPLGGDASLLVDLGNARLTVIEPDGRLTDTHPIVRGGGGPGGMAMAIPGGTDASGRVYYAGSAFGLGGGRDSIEVFRLDPESGDAEPIAMLRAPALDRQESGSANDRSVNVRPIPLSPVDAWGVTPEGGLFVARSGDYSVEYRAPDGSVREGDPVPYRPVRIGETEREEWAEEQARSGGVGVRVEEENGRRRISMARTTGRGGGLDDLAWPEVKPPFVGSRIRVDADGQGWIRRHLRAGEPALYDVFDRSGRHLRSVRFPEDRELVGFGRDAVYVAYIDEFDQQFLEAYPMP